MQSADNTFYSLEMLRHVVMLVALWAHSAYSMLVSSTETRSSPLTTESFQSDVFDLPWVNTSYASCSMQGEAVVSLDAVKRSAYIVMRDFGFSVPGAANVTAVSVILAVRISSARPDANRTREIGVSLVTGGTATVPMTFWPSEVLTGRSPWTFTGSNLSYPSGVDNALWNAATPTGYNISVPEFGVALRVENLNLFSLDALVSCVSITVNYTTWTSGTSGTTSVTTTGSTGILLPPPTTATSGSPPQPTTTTTTTPGSPRSIATTATVASNLPQLFVYILAFGGLGMLFLTVGIAWIVVRIKELRRAQAIEFARHGTVTMRSLEVESDTDTDSVLDSDIELDDITIGATIGTGHYGTVFLGLWQESTNVALKQVHNTQDASVFVDEAKTMHVLRHPNIVRLFGVFNTAGATYLVMEYAQFGALDTFLHSRATRDQCTAEVRQKFITDIACGMIYLDTLKIVHGDLGARNVLVMGNRHDLVAKITDFGLSVVCDREASSEHYHRIPTGKLRAIPVKYSAPEVVDGARYSQASDVWSFAVVAWEIYSDGQRPFSEKTNAEVLREVIRGTHRLQRPDKCPHDVYTMLMHCWSTDVLTRPTFADLLGFFTGTCHPPDISNGTDDDYQTFQPLIDNYQNK